MFTCVFSRHKQEHVNVLFLSLPSNVRMGFSIAIIDSIFRPDICLQNDKIVQAAHRPICGNNKKDHNSGIELGILPPPDKHRPGISYHHSFHSYSI